MSVSDFERVWLIDDECVCGHPHRDHSALEPHACIRGDCERFTLPPKTGGS